MDRKRLIFPIAAILFGSLLLGGCYKPQSDPTIVTEQQTPPDVILTAPHYIAGKSVEGRPIEYIVLGHGSDVTFILATIHGNETAGTPLVRRLTRYLRQNPKLLHGRKIVALPVANPDGMANKTRGNVRGVDLNRNFDTANRRNSRRFGRSALCEPESRIIKNLISQYSPNRIVTFHQPLSCIDYDGPARAIALRMARYCDLPVKKLGARPGSLGSYAGLTLGIPIITVELLKGDEKLSSQTLWRRYGKMLTAAVVYPQYLE